MDRYIDKKTATLILYASCKKAMLIHILAGILTASGLLYIFIYLRLRKLENQMVRDLIGEEIVKQTKSANYMGQGSKGMLQIRGNGVLILTKSNLYFSMLLPEKRLIIPVSSIGSLSTPKSFLGKTKGQKLLRADFDGDSAAWLVEKPEQWKRAIKEAKR